MTIDWGHDLDEENEMGCKCGCMCSCSAGAPCQCTRGDRRTAQEEFVEQVLEKRNGGREILPENRDLWAIGLAEEAGEVLGVLKKEYFHDHPRNDEKLLGECGDVLFYLTCLLYDRGLRLDDAMQTNMVKLKKRYPNGFSKEASRNRKD